MCRRWIGSHVARRAKKDPPRAGGWHAFLTPFHAVDGTNPIFLGFFNSACEEASYGWPCDPKMEALRDQFVRETGPAKQKDDLRGGARTGHRDRHAHSARTVVSALAGAQEPGRHDIGTGARVLEHGVPVVLSGPGYPAPVTLLKHAYRRSVATWPERSRAPDQKKNRNGCLQPHPFGAQEQDRPTRKSASSPLSSRPGAISPVIQNLSFQVAPEGPI